jgi:hypothetical protein
MHDLLVRSHASIVCAMYSTSTTYEINKNICDLRLIRITLRVKNFFEGQEIYSFLVSASQPSKKMYVPWRVICTTKEMK